MFQILSTKILSPIFGEVWKFWVYTIPRNTGTGTGSVPVPIFWNNPYWFLTCTHFMKIKMSPYPFRTNISFQPVPVPSPYSLFSKQTRTRTKMRWFYYVSVNPYPHSYENIIKLLNAERPIFPKNDVLKSLNTGTFFSPIYPYIRIVYLYKIS